MLLMCAPAQKPQEQAGQSGEDRRAKASASFLKKRSKKLLPLLAAASPATASPDS
jgi:hypothetical protein